MSEYTIRAYINNNDLLSRYFLTLYYMSKKNFKIDRSSVIEQAILECLTEMYAKAQPSADFNKLMELYKGTNKPFYQWYYLSEEEFHYILNKYLEAYKIKDNRQEYLDLIIDDISNEYFVDDYKKSYTDEYGFHPGYRDYKKEMPLKDKIGEDAVNKVFEVLKERNNFYKTNIEKERFCTTIALGCSPTSNVKTVLEHWGNIKIDSRHLTENDFYEEDFEQ